MEPYLIQCNDGEIEIEHDVDKQVIRIEITNDTWIDLNRKETQQLINILQKKLDLLV